VTFFFFGLNKTINDNPPVTKIPVVIPIIAPVVRPEFEFGESFCGIGDGGDGGATVSIIQDKVYISSKHG